MSKIIVVEETGEILDTSNELQETGLSKLVNKKNWWEVYTNIFLTGKNFQLKAYLSLGVNHEIPPVFSLIVFKHTKQTYKYKSQERNAIHIIGFEKNYGLVRITVSGALAGGKNDKNEEWDGQLTELLNGIDKTIEFEHRKHLAKFEQKEFLQAAYENVGNATYFVKITFGNKLSKAGQTMNVVADATTEINELLGKRPIFFTELAENWATLQSVPFPSIPDQS